MVKLNEVHPCPIPEPEKVGFETARGGLIKYQENEHFLVTLGAISLSEFITALATTSAFSSKVSY